MHPKASILVVDDTPANLTLLSDLLRDSYQVRAANGGARALEIARSAQPPDLILLDVLMPGIDGYAVCRELKNDPRTQAIPVIFLTSRADPADEERGLQLGAVDYIGKPISPPVVLARIRSQLQLQSYARQLEQLVAEHGAALAHSQACFRTFSERSLELNYASGYDTLAQLGVRIACELLPCEAGAFWECNSSGMLQLRHHTGAAHCPDYSLALFDVHSQKANRRDICTDCVHAGEARLLDTADPHSNYQLESLHQLDQQLGSHTTSLLALPLRGRDGSTLGVLCLFNLRGGRSPGSNAYALPDLPYLQAHAAHWAAHLLRWR